MCRLEGSLVVERGVEKVFTQVSPWLYAQRRSCWRDVSFEGSVLFCNIDLKEKVLRDLECLEE